MTKITDIIQTKQTVRQVWNNNLFLLKLCFSASPVFIITMVLDAFRNQLFIFFEHVYGIGYILEAAEYQYPFREVAVFILLLAGGIALGMLYSAITVEYIAAKELPKVRRRVKLALYEKAKEIDLDCYDNPDYYNELVLAVSEADKQIDRCTTLLQNTTAGITAFISTGIYFLFKDSLSVLFVVISFFMAFFFNQMFNKLAYKLRIEKNPFERKREYIKRVFYLNDYAKDLRLNPEASEILFQDFEKTNREVYRTEKSYVKRRFLLSFMRRYFSNDFFSDVIYISYLVIQAAFRKVLSFSSVAILYNSFGNLRRSMRIFTDVYPYASETSLYVQKIRNFLDSKPRIISEKNRKVSTQAKSIELKDVSFSYGNSKRDVIHDITLTIKPGEKIALVGYNGAGKTTLIKLLMRLYDTTGGEILLDGMNIQEYEVEQYRNAIGTVFQDFRIFAGSVKENVLLDANEKADEEKVKSALRHSGLSDRIKSLSMGLDTQLTTEFHTDGVNLSGGESQKLAIGRVFYKDAGLIILDEPSSALDPLAEYQLNHSMLDVTENKTVIFISHRLSTTRIADRIIMLEDGRIVEQGTHAQLLEQNGKYARMWQVQAGQYIDS